MSMRAFYLINCESKAEEARRWSAEALTAARSSGDPAALRTALEERSFVLNASSRVVEQLAVLDELAALSAGPVHPPRDFVDAALHRHVRGFESRGIASPWRRAAFAVG